MSDLDAIRSGQIVSISFPAKAAQALKNAILDRFRTNEILIARARGNANDRAEIALECEYLQYIAKQL